MTTEKFFHRDLSWIDFNGRVLEEGLRQDMPPLDRLWFLSIVSSNFDEFFMIRAASLDAALRGEISRRVRELMTSQDRCIIEEIFPALEKGGLALVRPEAYTISQMDFLEFFFMGQVFPLLTPLRLDAGLQAGAIRSRALYAAFFLEGGEEDEDEKIAVVPLPASLSRVIRLPDDADEADKADKKNGKIRWALLDDLVLTWGAYLFPGRLVLEELLFTVNRDADLSVDEAREEGFLEALEEALQYRSSSRVVRLVHSPGSRRLTEALAQKLELGPEFFYQVQSPLDLVSLKDDLFALQNGEDRLQELRSKATAPVRVLEDEPLWERIVQGDLLLHFPYESFDPVVRFFQDAAEDDQVLAIKTTLYRTSGDSPIVRSLERAALRGKQVTAVVELKARFDEERNISWANRLEKAGVIVVYGLARLKVHAKVCLVIRREGGRLRRYVHLSTGNYNEKTARQYEDLCLFTAREDLSCDAGLFFNMITGYSAIQETRRLFIAPHSLKSRLLALIDREVRRAARGEPARIMAKLNALSDPEMIEALYRASAGGVKIFLAVRGICLLVPGQPGLSENIRVVSVVGRYLEHSRIAVFGPEGKEECYLSSADWMPRNLERRVELMFPVLEPSLKASVLRLLGAYFRDNTQARVLDSGGRWTRLAPGPGEAPFGAQAYARALAEAAGERPRREFVVRRGLPAPG